MLPHYLIIKWTSYLPSSPRSEHFKEALLRDIQASSKSLEKQKTIAVQNLVKKQDAERTFNATWLHIYLPKSLNNFLGKETR